MNNISIHIFIHRMTGKTVSFAFVLFKHPTQQAKIRIVHGKYSFEKCRDEKCLIHAKSRVMRREQGGGDLALSKAGEA